MCICRYAKFFIITSQQFAEESGTQKQVILIIIQYGVIQVILITIQYSVIQSNTNNYTVNYSTSNNNTGAWDHDPLFRYKIQGFSL